MKKWKYYEIWHLNSDNLYPILEKVKDVIFDFDILGAKKYINEKLINEDFPNTGSLIYWVANEINYIFRTMGINIRVVSR